MTRSLETVGGRSEPVSEIDLSALADALKRRRRVYLIPTFLAFVLIAIFVNLATPRYTATSQVLLENQETFFTRPDRVNVPSEQSTQADETAVASQVQLISSPDIARRAIKELGLQGDKEFDPLARGMGPLTRVLVLLGLVRDPTRYSVEERITRAFLEKLTVYSPTKTRVITIQFTSRDPALSARAANLVAELYIQEQSAAKRGMAKGAADALASQIADLRTKLTKADDERERYRLQSGLLAGSNNMTISGQQLADINSDLSKARSAQADAQAKASTIRELLRAGKAADVAEVVNNDIVRRLWDQRAVAQAQLALESRTLLPGHPRIKELTGQVAQFDLALKSAAKQAASTLENEARISGTRVANLETVLAQQKKVAGVANTDEIRLRALDRNAQSLKDQLESSAAKYQEALARQSSTATPADARIISNATEPQDPSYPKKLPFILFGTIATFVFSIGFVVASELLSGRADVEAERVEIERVEAERVEPVPVAPAAAERRSSDFEERRASRFFDRINRSQQANLFDEPKPKADAAVQSNDLPPPKEAPSPLIEKIGLKGFAIGALIAPVITYAKGFGRSAEASRALLAARVKEFAREAVKIGSRSGDDEALAAPAMTAGEEQSAGTYLDLTQKIVAAHVPGRALQVVGASVGMEKEGAALVSLARALSGRGRTVVVDLNRTPVKLAMLAGDGSHGQAKIMSMHGLADLLAGDSSFAEVIHRDSQSRLHFIPTGLQEADFRDFDLILDALSETYDFILLLTPEYPNSEIARVMAPYADFVVLTADGASDGDTALVENELKEAGAREILLAGQTQRAAASVQDVA